MLLARDVVPGSKEVKIWTYLHGRRRGCRRQALNKKNKNIALTRHLLCARHCPTCFTYAVNSNCNPYNNPMPYYIIILIL